jgi:hypothetical protein
MNEELLGNLAVMAVIVAVMAVILASFYAAHMDEINRKIPPPAKEKRVNWLGRWWCRRHHHQHTTT